MKKWYVITAIALLSPAGVSVQAVAQPMNSNQRSAFEAPPSHSIQASAGNAPERLLEGCVRNANGNLTLTDVAGKVYRLRGDTAQLARHIGQEATVTGTEEPGSASGSAGAQSIFTVKKVPLIASTCAASK
jgi:hypothetical protein